MVVIAVWTSCSSMTQKHSVKPRPFGSSGSDSAAVAKRRSKRSRIASSAPRSHEAGVSRMSMRTFAPVRMKARMRDIFQARPTLRMPRSGQCTA